MSKRKKVKKKPTKQTEQTTQTALDRFFGTLDKHPYLFTALACVLMLPLGFAQVENITPFGIVIEAILWIAGATAFVAFCRPSNKRNVNIYLIVSSAALAIGYSALVHYDSQLSWWLFAPVLIGLAQLAVVLQREKKLTADRLVLMMILLGVAARYSYCLMHDYTQMQHDMGVFLGDIGHAGYISYWYENGFTLPEFDVTRYWQFYHPPLHHILMAGLLHFFTDFFGMPFDTAKEAIQILPMLYSALCMVVCRSIFRRVGLKGGGLAAAMLIVCFYPTFIIWSGAYNNDILTTLLMLLAILWTLKWAEKPTLLRILPIALCVGCGMMSKLSAWMVAPAIAMVFVWVFIRNIRKPLRFIGQYAAFGAVCAPLALWWGVRNLIKFEIPLTYVPDPNLSVMSVEDTPVLQRLFDFSFAQLSYPFEAFTMYGAPYNEYNPLMGLIKTSLFDEYNEDLTFAPLMTVFVVLALVLTVLSVAGYLIMLFKKHDGMDVMTKLFFTVILLTILISYYAFCFQFPYVCTENIRYCIPVIPILAMGFGFGIQLLKKKKTAA
ncbi:MAG: glycosyltransferase family 39 protein [Ruminococcus sp.]|nr:glycosyltransferase family 39 protein [Ruminococcus sp.]